MLLYQLFYSILEYQDFQKVLLLQIYFFCFWFFNDKNYCFRNRGKFLQYSKILFFQSSPNYSCFSSSCIFITLIDQFTLTPQGLKEYSKHVISSLSFISNIQYFREAGYFNAAPHEKLLLHTWSLSVEQQFYINPPILLVLFNKIFKSANTLKSFILFYY